MWYAFFNMKEKGFEDMKVTLLGDSIRQIGYGKRVVELLGEDFEVWQPDDNCRFAKYTMRGMWDWKEAMAGTKIVHWNNGLWDVCDILGDGKAFTSEAEYVENMTRLADIMLKRYDKIIFATTTPVDSENPHNRNDVIERYNKLLIPELKKRGVIINDLYSLIASDIDRYIRHDDHIHLSPEGIEVAAKQVADVIRKTAEEI